MPSKKIADLPALRGCRSPQHQPPDQDGRRPGHYKHVCPACGFQVRFSAGRPVAGQVVMQVEYTEQPAADVDLVAVAAFSPSPDQTWGAISVPEHLKGNVQSALDALNAREGEPAEDWAKRVAPIEAAGCRTSLPASRDAVPVYSGYVFGTNTLLMAPVWRAEIGFIVRRLHDPATTRDEAKALLRSHTKIINAWCAATGADDIPGGPFDHDLRGVNPHTGEPTLVWVVNGDVLKTSPLEGPAVAAQEWVRRFGQEGAP